MYIWIGCALPEGFSGELRTHCLLRSGELGLDTVGFSLPQHISLKISFDAGERYEEVLEYLARLLGMEKAFSVTPRPAEVREPIVWLPMAQNERLSRLHELLDRELEQRFGIMRHPFDKGFLFHSTLCTGSDPEKLNALASHMHRAPLPDTLIIDTVLLGISETGKSGSYRVVRRIMLTHS